MGVDALECARTSCVWDMPCVIWNWGVQEELSEGKEREEGQSLGGRGERPGNKSVGDRYEGVSTTEMAAEEQQQIGAISEGRISGTLDGRILCL